MTQPGPSPSLLSPPIPIGKKLVHAGSIPIGVWTDLTQVTLASGSFDYLIGGPGLTADALGLRINAAQGRLYVLYVSAKEDLETHFAAAGFQSKMTQLNTHIWVCPDYAVLVVNPAEHGMNNFRKEDMTPLNIDCLARPMAANPLTAQPGGLFILQPENVIESIGNIELTKIGNAYVFNPLVQLFTKCYMKMGYVIPDPVLKYIFQVRCANKYVQPNAEGFLDFKEEFSQELMTYIA